MGFGEVDEIVVREEKKDPFRRLVFGPKNLFEGGTHGFLIPTPENSMTLSRMVQNVTESVANGDRKGYLREVANVVHHVLPYSHSRDEAGVDKGMVGADLYRSLDNIVTARDMGFINGVLCRHHALVTLGLFRALEFSKGNSGRGFLETEEGVSSFVIMGFRFRDGRSHATVLDWRDRMVIDSSNVNVGEKGVFGLNRLQDVYPNQIDRGSVRIFVVSDGDTQMVTFRKFMSDPERYIP